MFEKIFLVLVAIASITGCESSPHRPEPELTIQTRETLKNICVNGEGCVFKGAFYERDVNSQRRPLQRFNFTIVYELDGVVYAWRPALGNNVVLATDEVIELARAEELIRRSDKASSRWSIYNVQNKSFGPVFAEEEFCYLGNSNSHYLRYDVPCNKVYSQEFINAQRRHLENCVIHANDEQGTLKYRCVVLFK